MMNLNFVVFVLVTVLVSYVKSEFIYSCTESKTIALTVRHFFFFFFFFFGVLIK